MRDWLFPPAWRSAVIVETLPFGAVYVGADLAGWTYYRDGRHLLAMHRSGATGDRAADRVGRSRRGL